MEKINYGNWQKKNLDFKGQYNSFKSYLSKGDKTMAKDSLKQFDLAKKALEDYRLWLHEQEKILIMYLSHIEEINSKDEIRFGKQRYIVG